MSRSLPPSARRGRRSILEPYVDEILTLYQSESAESIRQLLESKYGVKITTHAVYKFIKVRLKYAGESASVNAELEALIEPVATEPKLEVKPEPKSAPKVVAQKEALLAELGDDEKAIGFKNVGIDKRKKYKKIADAHTESRSQIIKNKEDK